MKAKRPTSFALTDEARRLLLKIANLQGISQSAALEVMIREKAAAMNIAPNR